MHARKSIELQRFQVVIIESDFSCAYSCIMPLEIALTWCRCKGRSLTQYTSKRRLYRPVQSKKMPLESYHASLVPRHGLDDNVPLWRGRSLKEWFGKIRLR
jgi:hypothetical protein